MEFLTIYEEWTKDPHFDKETKEELESIRHDEKEIKERFFKELEFGTGGLRGILGAGTNRMNAYTVGKAAQGLANYIISKGFQDKGVVIAYDTRRMSTEFALICSLCLNANGIKAYLFDDVRPTPELSFAIRELKCAAGIVITASHNPPEYNGVKVYWEDGAQVSHPMDDEIIREVNAVTKFSDVRTMDKEKAIAEGLLSIVGKELDELYINCLKKLVINEITDIGKELKIVYTPLHGAANKLVKRVLKEVGFTNVYVVPEQEEPDSEFSTVEYPNPEDPEVYKLSLELARKVDADIILATDPDGDRIGAMVKVDKGEYEFVDGNMSGSLMAEYIFSQKDRKGLLPDKAALIKTIVTGNIPDEIAKYYNATLIKVLTGFKYIGQKIKEFEEDKSHEYIFGYEESYGCLYGTHARDKDAVGSVLLLCEAAAYYKEEGYSLYEQIGKIYEKYGYYQHSVVAVTLKGIEGMDKINDIMANYRNNPPKTVGGGNLIQLGDYQLGEITDLKTGEKAATNLPKSNVLHFELDNDAWFAIRPSGTEPKIKYYYGVKGESAEDAKLRLKNLTEDPIF